MTVRMGDRIKDGSGKPKVFATPEPAQVWHGLREGEALEYRILRLLMYMGYYARRGRVIYTVGRLDHATDLDILAIKHSNTLKREIWILECKTGKEGPLDRAFWLAGLSNYTRADRATLVRRVTKWNIKDFAKRCRVEIWDFEHIDALETTYEVDRDTWPGASDRRFFLDRLPDWQKLLKADQRLRDVYLTLAGEISFEDVFPGINFILHHMRALTRDLHRGPEEVRSLLRFLLAESASQLALFLARLTETTFDLSSNDRARYISKGMTYGDTDPGVAERILDRARGITEKIVQYYVNRPVPIDEALFQMPGQPHTPEIVSFVEDLVSLPSDAARLPQSTDLLLWEAFIKGGALDLAEKVLGGGSNTLLLAREFVRRLVAMEAFPEDSLCSAKHEGTIGETSGQPIRAVDEEARGSGTQQTALPIGSTSDVRIRPKA